MTAIHRKLRWPAPDHPAGGSEALANFPDF
jgi:hypothetical protein